MNTLTSIPEYEDYKDSGEQWMAEVPKHWEVKRLKHIFYEKKHTFNPKLNCGSISFGEVVTKDDEKIPFSTKASYQEVLKDEFLINPLNLNYDLISLRIALSKIDVVVSAGYIVLKDKEKIIRDYYKYLLHRYDVAYMKLLGSGVRQTINFGHIANSLLVLPPIKEQAAIANFLDRKTVQIDQAIAIKEKQIALLKERKQILIQNAVTRGLDPNVPMKDSGVEWIGEIPEHWQLKRLKYICENIQTGTTPSTSNPKYFGGDINWYNPKDLDEELLVEADNKITTLALNRNEAKLFKGDSVLIVGIGATTGKTAYMPCPASFNQQITAFHSDSENNKYLFYLLRGFSQVMLRVASYTTLPILNNGFFKSFILVLPPSKEQYEIVSYVEINSKKLDESVHLQEKQIQKLKEYKSTLINSAVTGKIKVA